ncbi:DEAD/DEAH box helicase [Moraxella oblonga]|uniref:DEAD/DEAH box helicase n=1 Tax=Moraxella oblonga TaxID=200413 RepID=UPI00082CB86B|nr:DEAD/DEAH box helicase [Moraxella oblonga]
MTDQTQNTTTFADLNLHSVILKALEKSGYTTPTPIQAGAIPHALNGRDLLLSAQTGSGKTASFVLPILDKLAKTPKPKLANADEFSQKSHRKHQKTPIKALILTPTRELAMQVQDNVRKYSSQMRGVFSVPLVGGAPYGGQIRALHKGVQIVIATPGRLIDHMNDGRVDLSELDTLVLDEADRMLDMGFSDAIETILAQVPTTRQTVMSSATWDGAVGKIAESFTKNPERISIKVESAHIDESVYFCDDFNHKNKILLELLNNDDIGQAIIFTATKKSTEQLAQTLTDNGLSARYLHGDLPQGKRNRIISDVKSGKCDFLIATDVAARGIDISTISHVVNYDLPRQVEDYVHRIGRCGRAGRTGVAMNLCSRDDQRQLGHINRYLSREMKENVIAGLEPKFTPKKDQDKRKHGRKFDNNRFQNRPRQDKSKDFYQKSFERTFEKFGKINNPYERGERNERFENNKPNPHHKHFDKSSNHNDDKSFEKKFNKSAKTDTDKKFGKTNKPARRDVTELDREYHAKMGRDVKNEKTKEFSSKRGRGRSDEPLYSTTAKRPKKRVIEEVFFDKRQTKKSKKFGEL